MRLSIDLTPTLVDALDAQQERLGAGTRAETVRALIRGEGAIAHARALISAERARRASAATPKDPTT